MYIIVILTKGILHTFFSSSLHGVRAYPIRFSAYTIQRHIHMFSSHLYFIYLVSAGQSPTVTHLVNAVMKNKNKTMLLK